ELPLNPLEIPDKKGTFTEAVNTARTALCLDEGQRRRKVIVITSSVPGEGKSTAAINLAFSLAQLERVLLVDCDMRRPTIAKAAGMDKNVSGLSNLITGSAPARKCIKRGVFDGTFDILPSGPIPEQPLELLSSKRFEKILEQLGEHYDRIVIDSAPTQAVSDALVLGKLSDAVVYIVKSHETSMDLVKRGTQRLKQIGAPLAGVLITQVDIDKITSYGGDYYYQGYYDYYGYTEKGDKSRRGGNKMRLTQEELMHIRTDDSEVNLDLDYGYSPNAGDDVPLTADEFDRTTKLDAGSANGSVNGSYSDASETVLRGGLKRRVARDDLDIL
ncbi:MAG: CpsD/CapB family tyrosine-protein kinase, partial [Methylococcales bacterium]|nr:CpsD/CapB family tyrosine-protein kinase [Methylococcales bacterium]